MEAEVRVIWGHEAMNADGLLKLKNIRKQILSHTLQKEYNLADTVFLGFLTFKIYPVLRHLICGDLL